MGAGRRGCGRDSSQRGRGVAVFPVLALAGGSICPHCLHRFSGRGRRSFGGRRRCLDRGRTSFDRSGMFFGRPGMLYDRLRMFFGRSRMLYDRLRMFSGRSRMLYDRLRMFFGRSRMLYDRLSLCGCRCRSAGDGWRISRVSVAQNSLFHLQEDPAVAMRGGGVGLGRAGG